MSEIYMLSAIGSNLDDPWYPDDQIDIAPFTSYRAAEEYCRENGIYLTYDIPEGDKREHYKHDANLEFLKKNFADKIHDNCMAFYEFDIQKWTIAL